MGAKGKSRLAHQDSEFTDDGHEKPAAVVPAGSDGGVLIGAKRGAAGGVRYGSSGNVQINHKDLRPSYRSKLLFLVSGLRLAEGHCGHPSRCWAVEHIWPGIAR